MSAARRGLFYFAWGCFRDFVSGRLRRTAEEALRPGREIISASRLRRIDSTLTHHALVGVQLRQGAEAGTVGRRFLAGLINFQYLS